MRPAIALCGWLACGLATPTLAQTVDERLEALELDVFQLKHIHGLNPPQPADVVHEWLQPAVGLDVGHVDLASEHTITAIFAANSWPVNGWSRIMSQADGVNDQNHDFMLSDDNAGGLRIRHCTDGRTTNTAAGVLAAGAQVRVDVTYDGAAMKAYVDGLLVMTVPKTGLPCNTAARRMRLGAQPPNGTNQLRGTIARVAIRGVAWSQADIDADMGAAPPVQPPEPPPEAPQPEPDEEMSFAALCAHPSVVKCVDFDTSAILAGAAFNNSAGYPFPVAIDSSVFYEGGGAQRHTINGMNGFDTSGTVGYAFPSVSTGSVFVSWRMRTGNGLQALLKRGGFGTASGLKFLQVVAGARSCSSEEITVADNFMNAISTGALQLSNTCSGFPYRAGDDWQPVQGNLDNCGYWYFASHSGANTGTPNQSPPCVLLQDDTWHLITLEIAIGQGVRMWIDNALTIDQGRTVQGTLPSGPYGRVYIDNYATGHQAGEMGDIQWPVWYDNLIISTECVTGCGGTP